MRVMWNYIRCIHRSRSEIRKHMWWHVVIRVSWHAWMRVRRNDWIIITRMILMNIFSLHTPWNIFLREPWAGNVYYTMVI